MRRYADSRNEDFSASCSIGYPLLELSAWQSDGQSGYDEPVPQDYAELRLVCFSNERLD